MLPTPMPFCINCFCAAKRLREKRDRQGRSGTGRALPLDLGATNGPKAILEHHPHAAARRQPTAGKSFSVRPSLSPICSAIATASPPTACRNEGSVVISASELTAHRGAVREILKSRAVSGTSANFSRGAVAAGNFPVPLTRPARGSPRRAGARAPRRRAATSRSRLVSIPALAPIHPGDAHNLRPHVQPVTGRACPVARIEFQRRHRGSC